MNDKKVLVAISGGIDSAVTALLLKQNGYCVTGCILNMHKFNKNAIEDAKIICQYIGIELIIADVSCDFTNIIQANFYNEYMAGRTPNPCVICNKELKFKSLIDIANQNKIEKIATGHYAKSQFDTSTNRHNLLKANATKKDQTYMLWRLPQEFIARTIFPLGEFQSKEEIREFAKSYKIPCSNRVDSQDICFIPDSDYRSFITNFCQSETDKIKPGDIIVEGKIVGKHRGLPFYTIGQRRGLGIAYKTPLYVKNIDVASNIVELATLENTYSNGLLAANINIIKYKNYLPEKEYLVKIRYKDAGKPAICKLNDGKLEVNFIEKRSAVAAGQSVVLYDKEVLIAGGIIESAF